MSNNIRPGVKLTTILSGIIAANPGISSVDISDKSGYSLSHTKRSLCELSRAGMFSPVRMNGKEGAGWFPADQAADARKKYGKSTATVVRDALEVIILKPGSSARCISALIGRSMSYTAWALTVLSTQGKAKPVRVGNRIDGWFTAEHAAEKIAEAESAKRAKLEKRAARKANPPVTAMDRIVEQSKGYEGTSYSLVESELGLPHASISASIYKLQRKGRLFKAMRAGCRARWFNTAERAAEWAAKPKMVVSEFNPTRQKATQHPAQARRMAAIGERLKSKARQPSKAPPLMKGSSGNKPGDQLVTQQKPAKPASVHIADRSISFQKREADYSGAKITRYESPKFDARYQVDPDSIPRFRYGSGSQL